MPYISSIKTAVPKYCYAQEDAASFLTQRVDDPKERKKINIIFRRSGVKTRYSVLPDFNPKNERWMLFDHPNDNVPLVESRLSIFKTSSIELLQEAGNKLPANSLNDITDLITVSCTGMMSPGLEIKLAEKLKLNSTIRRYPLNFMGCYGGMSALRMAETICRANPLAKVLIADVELTSIHYCIPKIDDHIIATSLFADGASVAIVSGEKPKTPSLQIIETATELMLDGQKDMTWEITSKGFLMTLSSYVPILLEANLKGCTENLFSQKLDPNELNWAIHPGGPRVLNKFASVVNVSKNAFRDSFEILENYGNMSSVTIFFIMEKAWNRYFREGKSILGAAFGPGLSMEAGLFKPV